MRIRANIRVRLLNAKIAISKISEKNVKKIRKHKKKILSKFWQNDAFHRDPRKSFGIQILAQFCIRSDIQKFT